MELYYKDKIYRVQVVLKGDKYGLRDCHTHNEAEPLVEFYLVREDVEDPLYRSMMISRYNLSTLCKHIEESPGYGLNLHGGFDDCCITNLNIIQVINYTIKKMITII